MKIIYLLKISLIALIYFPLAIIYSIIWGLICGTVGVTLGTYQDLRDLIGSDIFDWKKWPKRKNIRYWKYYGKKLKFTPKKIAEIMEQAAKGERRMPTPLWIIPYWCVRYFFIWIYRLGYGIFIGPLSSFDYTMDIWYEHILKKERKKER